MSVESTVCKFRCTEVAHLQGGNERIKLEAQYDEALDEDRRFAKATPQGLFEFYISNPNVYGFYQPGKTYHLNITAAE